MPTEKHLYIQRSSTDQTAVFGRVVQGIAIAPTSTDPSGLPQYGPHSGGSIDAQVYQVETQGLSILDMDQSKAPDELVRLANQGVIRPGALIRHAPEHVVPGTELYQGALHFLDDLARKGASHQDPEQKLSDVLGLFSNSPTAPNTPDAIRIQGHTYVRPDRPQTLGIPVTQPFAVQHATDWKTGPQETPPKDVQQDIVASMTGAPHISPKTQEWFTTHAAPVSDTVVLYRGLRFSGRADASETFPLTKTQSIQMQTRTQFGVDVTELRPGSVLDPTRQRPDPLDRSWTHSPSVARIFASHSDGLGVVQEATFARKDIAADFTRLHPTLVKDLGQPNHAEAEVIIRAGAIPNTLRIHHLAPAPDLEVHPTARPAPYTTPVSIDTLHTKLGQKLERVEDMAQRASLPVRLRPTSSKEAMAQELAAQDPRLQQANAQVAAATQRSQQAHMAPNAGGPIKRARTWIEHTRADRAVTTSRAEESKTLQQVLRDVGPNAAQAFEQQRRLQLQAEQEERQRQRRHARLLQHQHRLEHMHKHTTKMMQFGHPDLHLRQGQGTASAVQEAYDRDAPYRAYPHQLSPDRIQKALNYSMKDPTTPIPHLQLLHTAVERTGMQASVDAQTPGRMQALLNRTAPKDTKAPLSSSMSSPTSTRTVRASGGIARERSEGD